MRIQSISFRNNKTGWNVSNVDFRKLTLLVGASGVGKTQILKALYKLSMIARGNSFNGMEWNTQFVLDGSHYTWSGAFESVDVEEEVDATKDFMYDILWEQIMVGDTVIVDRDLEHLLYNGVETVKLDKQVSAIELLKQESLIEPIYNAFRRIYMLQTDGSRGVSITPKLTEPSKALTLSEIKQLNRPNGIDKLFLLKKNNLPEFNQICESFIDIFPSVECVDFTLGMFFNERTFPILEIKEKGSDSWIRQPDISSGMLRTLTMLVTLYLAEDGDIILIDEFENGLGVNCIDELASLVKDPDSDIQVVMTSHHPYIINTIPYQSWKVVARKGSNVFVKTAAELNIGDFSKHDAFMQLVQSPTYKQGVL